METPAVANGQFVDTVALTSVISTLVGTTATIGKRLHTPGLLSPSALVFTPSLLTVQVQMPLPFLVLFATGHLVPAHGLVSNADTSTTTVNMAPLVPGGGSVTAYIVASASTIGQSLTTVIGPPPGHPDYDPTFSPYEFDTVTQDTLTLTATTSAPDNLTTFEICRITLSVGQSTITGGQIDKTHWTYASAVLNPTGVTATNYPGATVTVGLDGRITGISSVAYGPLAGTNDWTGTTNTFENDVTMKAATFFGTGGQFLINPNNGGNQLLQFATNQYLQFQVGGGFALSTTGAFSITAPAGVATSSNVTVGGNLTGDGNCYFNATTFGTAFGTGVISGQPYLGFAGGRYLTYLPGPDQFTIQVGGTPPGGASLSVYASGKVVTSCWYEVDGTLATTVSNAGFVNNFATPPANGAPGGYIGGATGAVVSISCPSGSVLATGFYASSDARLKEQVQPLADDVAMAFLNNTQPVTYVMEGRFASGFIAQDMIRAGYAHMVSEVPDERAELRDTTTAADGLINPGGQRFVLDYQQIIAYQQAALQNALTRIARLEYLIERGMHGSNT